RARAVIVSQPRFGIEPGAGVEIVGRETDGDEVNVLPDDGIAGGRVNAAVEEVSAPVGRTLAARTCEHDRAANDGLPVGQQQFKAAIGLQRLAEKRMK